MAVKDSMGGLCWTDWEEGLRLREEETLAAYEKKLEEEIRFYVFIQYMFRRQWMALKAYANEKGIRIIGDIPIYVSFDIVRIDHFRGFDAYYSIPYGDTTAVNGHWERGVGIDLFAQIKKELGEMPIIAEDLGYVTDTVKKLLEDTGYPGMKVLQFAFDSREAGCYMPYKYPTNSVVYTGTHDNDTIVGWYQNIREEDRKIAQAYLNNADAPKEKIPWDYICCALSCVADTCIIPVQDYLGLGSGARINTPSVASGNWKWRMKQDAFSGELCERIRFLAEIYGRC